VRSRERGSQGTIEKKQRIGDGHLINDAIPEPYGYEIDTREVERNNQREIGMAAKYYKATIYSDGTFEVSDYKGDAYTLNKIHGVYHFCTFGEGKRGVYAIRQSKMAAIKAIRKHLEKSLIEAKEEVAKIEKTLLQLK
jgi:hypothetical protein